MTDADKAGWWLLDMDDEGAGVLAYGIDDGEIDEDEIAPIWERFESAEARGDKIRIYAEMHAMPSVSGGLIVDKLKRLKSIMSTVERFALVGDAGWLGIYTKLVDPITKAEIKHFSFDESEQAKNWIWET